MVQQGLGAPDYTRFVEESRMVLPSAKNYATIGGQVHVRDLCCRARTRVSPPLPLGEGWGEGTQLHGHALHPHADPLPREEGIGFARYGLYRRELCASC